MDRSGSMAQRHRSPRVPIAIALALAALAACSLLMSERLAHAVLRRVHALVRSAALPVLALGHAGAPAQAAVATGAVPPTQIGVTTTAIAWYSGEQAFANLAVGNGWTRTGPGGWGPLDAAYTNADGSLLGLPAGAGAARFLVRTETGKGGIEVQCRFAGNADVTAAGAHVTDVRAARHGLSFHWVNLWEEEGSAWIQVGRVDPHDPLRDLDCREAGVPADAVFAPAFLASLEGFRVLRFMDWQRTNQNAPIRWATRHGASANDYSNGDGVPIERMVDLANTVGTDAWFNIPWNADDDYVARFAALVRDRLAPGHKAYVELSNEVWNAGFPVAGQAAAEGRRAGLGSNPDEAQLRRYAQRTVEVMKLWEQAFAQSPGRLVRVAATQDANPRVAEIVFAYPGIAQHVDALATAPYFGFDLMQEGQTGDLDEIFRRLTLRVDASLDGALRNKAIAQRYGKRYLSYEAGQHVIIPWDLTLEQRIERDPRMADLYRRYIDGWRRRVGDTLMLYSTAQVIGTGGAWGFAEHSGQPIADAPKLRAIKEELTAH